ncbi:MAG: hypothetical protein QXX91_01755 [Thermoplasmata archaeon]
MKIDRETIKDIMVEIPLITGMALAIYFFGNFHENKGKSNYSEKIYNSQINDIGQIDKDVGRYEFKIEGYLR